MRSIAGSAPGGGPSAPLRPHPEQPSQPQTDPATVPLPPTPAVNGKPTSSAESSDASDVDDFRVREIQRLVAAGTPSHRHAWKRDSDAWKRFLSRHDDDDALDDIAAIGWWISERLGRETTSRVGRAIRARKEREERERRENEAAQMARL